MPYTISKTGIGSKGKKFGAKKWVFRLGEGAESTKRGEFKKKLKKFKKKLAMERYTLYYVY